MTPSVLTAGRRLQPDTPNIPRAKNTPLPPPPPLIPSSCSPTRLDPAGVQLRRPPEEVGQPDPSVTVAPHTLQSWKIRPSEFNVLIVFRSWGGHRSLDRARHPGVSRVSHARTQAAAAAGQNDSAGTDHCLLSLHGELQPPVHSQHLSRHVGRLQEEERRPGHLVRLAEPSQRDGARHVLLPKPRRHFSADEPWKQRKGRGFTRG